MKSARIWSFSSPYFPHLDTFHEVLKMVETNGNIKMNCVKAFLQVNNDDYFFSACNCDRRGSFTRTCRRYDGQCPCLRNYGGRQCHQCRVGYFDFPSCRCCNCVPAGIMLTPEAPTGCYQYDPVSAQH